MKPMLNRRESLRGFTLVEILIVVAILALLVSLAVPGLIRARVNANDKLAQNTLRVMAKATEIYMAERNGVYPSNMSSLTSLTPPYLNYDYCGTMDAGFDFDCENMISGYLYTATPSSMGLSGSTMFSITTGGILSGSSN